MLVRDNIRDPLEDFANTMNEVQQGGWLLKAAREGY
jgi:hypothetical protein